MKEWAILFTKAHGYHRETYSLFGYYLDLFFKNGGDIELDNFQNLGLACFNLAAKTVEKNPPDLREYDKQQILNYEPYICFKLNFRMAPQTYTILADELLLSWDNFIEDSQAFQVTYLTENGEPL